ncbi:hypothetical protein POM88_049036 [Heracleum sosnowskyi]|uniref:Uncharacterized protein n=1 Tax=Heracleum sosnowskyi TaxID=360622 RepID=A0AAD8GXJ0_9APIA|nr:hypothetical protein POM88_049036 [Heracleum sosnowskyi]
MKNKLGFNSTSIWGFRASVCGFERSKLNEYKEGRRLLDRCDKLLNSIAEMNATESQPSPVSVLDSSYYKDDSSLSPSPVIKRHLSYPGIHPPYPKNTLNNFFFTDGEESLTGC